MHSSTMSSPSSSLRRREKKLKKPTCSDGPVIFCALKSRRLFTKHRPRRRSDRLQGHALISSSGELARRRPMGLAGLTATDPAGLSRECFPDIKGTAC